MTRHAHTLIYVIQRTFYMLSYLASDALHMISRKDTPYDDAGEERATTAKTGLANQ